MIISIIIIIYVFSLRFSHTHLHYDRARLTLGYSLMLLQIKVEIVSITILQHGAKRIRIDLKDIIELHHARMIQRLVYVVLPQCVSRLGFEGEGNGIDIYI